MTDVKAQIAALGSDLERAFDSQLQRLGTDLPDPWPLYRFDQERRWKFDRAWPPYLVAVEIEGGEYGPPLTCQNCGSPVHALKADGSVGAPMMRGGFHARFARFRTDREKYNRAAQLGWLVLRYFNEDIYGNPFAMVDQIRCVLRGRQSSVPVVPPLVERQVKVLALVAAGFTSAQIAQRLRMGEHTVKRYCENICIGLGVTNRPAAVARAIAWGLLDPGQVPFAEEVPDLGVLRRENDE